MLGDAGYHIYHATGTSAATWTIPANASVPYPTFGHGRHTCPAQPFSLSAMTATATELFAAFDFEPRWTGPPGPLRSQIGGVARAAGPCPVRYHRR